jgi:hypothetical protein
MTAITGWFGFVLRLVGMVGVLWLFSAAADHVWPEAKWYVIALFVGGWVFFFARQFGGEISQFRGATDAFVHRRISDDLPSSFRTLRHEKTLQQVMHEFGPPSRKLDLVAPVGSGSAPTKFVAYVYELPYEAAVFVMPEPPGMPDSMLQAVYYRPRADDDELFSPVRA